MSIKYHIGRDPSCFGNVYCGNQLIIANNGGGISDALIELVEAANQEPTKDQPVELAFDDKKLDKLWELSKRDDFFDFVVPSTIRELIEDIRRSRMTEQPVEVSSVEVNNLLHRMNLTRQDIAALPDGSTIAINVTTHRQAADLIKRLDTECRTLKNALVDNEPAKRHNSTTSNDCEKAFRDYFDALGNEHMDKAVRVLGIRGLLWCVWQNGWKAGRSE